jgi:diadenosine tetraphosphate (Ap4A) HIT family hydrolase
MEDCIFCNIVSGEIKTPGVFWEDEKFIAFLSIFPSVEGFSVVAPKKHYGSDVLAMPDEDLKEFVIAAKKVSNILLNHFEDVGRVGLVMEGTGVDHAHIKLIPMHGTEYMKRGEWRQVPSLRTDFYEKYEGWLASHDGPAADNEDLKRLADQLRAAGQ